MARVSHFRLIWFFFMGLWWPNIIAKIHKEPEPTEALISYSELWYLLDCNYLRLYQVGNLFLHWKSHVIGQCRCHWRLSVYILSHFKKIVEQYNNLGQVERITCVLETFVIEMCFFVVVFALGAYTLFLFYYSFATLVFNGRRAKAKVLFRKTNGMCNCHLENDFTKVWFWFNVSSKLIRWNARDRFQTVKFQFAGSRLFACYQGICFASKLPIE